MVHTTADPDVFVVENDTAFDRSEGVEIVSMVKIFRMRDGEIVLMRDYFSPDLVADVIVGGMTVHRWSGSACRAPRATAASRAW